MRSFRLPAAPLVALALALFSLAPVAWASDNTADEADLAFSRGNEAFGRGRYEEALQHYFLSNRLVANRNVLFNIARCYEALGRFDEAYRYHAELSLQALSAEDAQEVGRSLARIRPRVALLQVESLPPGAEVYVERVDLGARGRTPLTLALPPGTHQLLLRKEGFHPAARATTVARGKEVVEHFELERVTGKVRLEGTPAGAWVKESEDGQVLGTLPTVLRLPPGQKLLQVGATGHQSGRYLVEVKPQEELLVQVALGPARLPEGRLVVTSNRENALVAVNGKEEGFTPVVLTLPEGRHRVSVFRPELTLHEEEVTVEEEKEARVHAVLRYRPPKVKAASKSLAQVDEAPASITVITREEIDAFGYQTLAQALAPARGLYLTDDRVYTYLGIRGFSPPGDLNTRLLILWDGHPLNDVWAGQGFAGRDLSVDLDEVERIELVRGPGSALYGTGAFFAVVNLVPRDGLGKKNVEVTGGAGAQGSWRTHLAAAHQVDDQSSLLVSAAAFSSRGAELTALGPLGVVHGGDAERAYNATARVRHRGLTVFALVNNRHKQIPTGPYGSLPGAAGTRSTDSRGFVEARWEGLLPKGALSVRAYYDGTRYAGVWPTAAEEPGTEAELSTDAARADWGGGEARFKARLFAHNHLSAGLEAQHQARLEQQVEIPEGTLLERRRRTLLSAYLLDEWALHPRAFLSLGLRVDKYLDLDALPVTPRAALIVRPYLQGVTKLVAGQAFRAPNAYELYYHDLQFIQRQPERLVPESITTFEVEHAHDVTGELRVTLAGYHNRIRDLVVLGEDALEVPRCGAPTGTAQCLVYGNAPGLVRTFGAEAGLRWQPGRFLLVDASYSYVRLVGSASELTAGAPTHLATGRMMVPLMDPSVRLSLQAIYQSARYSPRVPEGAGEALLLDAGLSGESEHLRWFAGVKNLLDVDYALPVGTEFSHPVIPQYRRTFTLQLGGRY